MNVSKIITGLALSLVVILPVEAKQDELYWAGCGVTKKSFMNELARAYTGKTGINVKVEGGGATRGIRATVAKELDIGGTCRMTLPDVEKSEMFASLHPVAWDALAVITHKSNPVKSLTRKQIKGVYSGKISNWSQLGGPDLPIKLYVRRGKISGVGYAIRQYIFKDSQMDFKTSHTVNSSGPLEEACESDPAAIGITGISSARKRNVKILDFDGNAPSFANIKSGTYGLYRPLYLVTGSIQSRKVKDFLKFAKSKEGRSIIRNNGTVPYMDAPQLLTKLLIYGFDVK